MAMPPETLLRAPSDHDIDGLPALMPADMRAIGVTMGKLPAVFSPAGFSIFSAFITRRRPRASA